MNNFTLLVLAMLGLSVILQLWLATRQGRYVAAHRDRVPEAFRESISLGAHQRAADYTVAQARFSRTETIYSAALFLLWTLGGGFEWIDQSWRNAELASTATGVAVLLSAVILMSALELPTSIYQTFVIEQRFGFNRTTAKTFVGDLLKGLVLLLALGTPFAWLILWIMDVAGEQWWFFVWLTWFGFMLLMMWAYPTLIAPVFNKFEPLSDEELKRRIERLLEQCGFHSSGVFVMDGSRRSSHGNAYFGGIGNNKRIVFFDTLIQQLEPDEIEAVLAHELGHFRLRHIRKRLIWMGLSSLAGLALLGWLIEQPWFFAGLGVNTPSHHMGLLLFMILAPLFGFLATPLLSLLSRKHEFQADDYAAQKRDPQLLVSALVKLYRENASTLTPDPVYSKFYYSHPPASDRIRHLRGEQANPATA